MFQFAFVVLLAFANTGPCGCQPNVLFRAAFLLCGYMNVEARFGCPVVIFDLSPTHILGKDLSVSLDLTDWLSSNL